jgi:hypothetical protein
MSEEVQLIVQEAELLYKVMRVIRNSSFGVRPCPDEDLSDEHTNQEDRRQWTGTEGRELCT